MTEGMGMLTLKLSWYVDVYSKVLKTLKNNEDSEEIKVKASFNEDP